MFFFWIFFSTVPCGVSAPGGFRRENLNPSTGLQTDVFWAAGMMPGTIPTFADLDGDARWDFVAVRLSGYGYRIAVILSSRPEVALLTPPAPLGIVTVHVCDINGDHVQDIPIRSPVVAHPVAVWLGKGDGSFEAVDQRLFQGDRRSVDSAACQNSRRSVDPEILLDPSHSVCEKISVRTGRLDPDPSGFITEARGFVTLQRELSGLAPRSPPSIPVS
jgi:hypothetical protein